MADTKTSELPLIAVLTIAIPLFSAVITKILDVIVHKSTKTADVNVKELEQDTALIHSLMGRVTELENKLNSLYELNRLLTEENSRLKSTQEFHAIEHSKLTEEIQTLKESLADQQRKENQLLNKINTLTFRLTELSNDTRLK